MSLTQAALALLIVSYSAVAKEVVVVKKDDVPSLECYDSATTKSSEILGFCDVLIGHSVTVPCGAVNAHSHSDKSYNYTIYYKNKSVKVKKLKGSFLWYNVTERDYGAIFDCRHDDGRARYVFKIMIGPAVKPAVKIPSAVFGMPLTISCPLDSNPLPTYNWTRYSDIDKGQELPWPDGLVFVENGTKETWATDYWTSDYNGYYVCCAENALASVCYHDINDLRLFADRCENIMAVTSSLIIMKDKQREIAPGDHVIIECYISNTYCNQLPIWMRKMEDSYALVSLNSDHFVAFTEFDEEACTWVSELEILNFTSLLAGEYACRHGDQTSNITLEMGRCYDNVVTDYSVQLFPSTKASYSAGSAPVLTCQAVNTDPLHHPRWCKETESGCVILDGDETGAMDPASLNITYSFAESNCTWIAHLELKSFSGGASGTYTCYILGTNVKSNVSIELLEEAASAAHLSSGDIAGLVTTVVLVVGIVASVCTATAILVLHRNKVKYSSTTEPPSEGFTWDVFISYHREVEEFAYQHVKLSLERQWPQYSVCWHHDDFLAGRTILENIYDAVDKSRKIVFIFSSSFSESDHCMAELFRTLDRLQMTRTRCLVPIVLDEASVPEELKSRVTYWPVVKPDVDFQQRLMAEIGPPIKNNH